VPPTDTASKPVRGTAAAYLLTVGRRRGGFNRSFEERYPLTVLKSVQADRERDAETAIQPPLLITREVE
jgi:hypothetical protein